MDFKKIRIIEAGPTANDWTDEVNGELKTGKIVITPESLASLVVAGSIRPIHSRRTHNGNDLLDHSIAAPCPNLRDCFDSTLLSLSFPCPMNLYRYFRYLVNCLFGLF